MIDLAVAIAVMGILIAILLPAVQRAREAARRLQCTNNLKQLGLGLHVYHDLHARFPAGSLNSWSWIAQMLPEMEQANVQHQLNFDLDLQDAMLAGQNVVETDTIIPVLNCPSDPNGASIFVSPEYLGKPFAHTNYLGTLSDQAENANGMFGVESFVRLRDVVDGTSQTLFVGERGVDYTPYTPSATGQFGWWIMGAPLETFMKADNGLQDGATQGVGSINHWWSWHDGGLAFLFVDGSVHFLNDSMDQQVFNSLGTRSGGELNTQPF